MNEIYQNHDPFELSAEYIDGVMYSAAKSLVLHGTARVNQDGLRFKRDDGPTPYEFTYKLPLGMAQELFFGGHDLMLSRASAYYTMPRRIDDELGSDGMIDSFSLNFEGKIPGTKISTSHTYYLGRNDQTLERAADISFEHSEDDLVIGRKRVEIDGELTEENIDDLVQMLTESHRNMDLNDISKILAVTDFISQHPQRDLE